MAFLTADNKTSSEQLAASVLGPDGPPHGVLPDTALDSHGATQRLCHAVWQFFSFYTGIAHGHLITNKAPQTTCWSTDQIFRAIIGGQKTNKAMLGW